MRALKKYWMSLLALVLLLASGFVLFAGHLPARQLYETEKTALITRNDELRTQLQGDYACALPQGRLDPAIEAIQASRRELYDKFPVELWEEDQILYMLYLEEMLGQDVIFRFAQAEDLVTLSDGAVLQSMTFTFDYETTYEGFKRMVQKIVTDERVASVRYATLQHDAAGNSVSGELTIMLYLLQDGRAYTPPVSGGEVPNQT